MLFEGKCVQSVVFYENSSSENERSHVNYDTFCYRRPPKTPKNHPFTRKNAYIIGSMLQIHRFFSMKMRAFSVVSELKRLSRQKRFLQVMLPFWLKIAENHAFFRDVHKFQNPRVLRLFWRYTEPRGQTPIFRRFGILKHTLLTWLSGGRG